MKALTTVALAGVALGGLAFLASEAMADEGESGRMFWLVQGKRYAISHRLYVGWSADMYPGFCNFSGPVMTASGTAPAAWAEVQFTAEWCQANRQFQVPADMAIAEV